MLRHAQRHQQPRHVRRLCMGLCLPSISSTLMMFAGCNNDAPDAPPHLDCPACCPACADQWVHEQHLPAGNVTRQPLVHHLLLLMRAMPAYNTDMHTCTQCHNHNQKHEALHMPSSPAQAGVLEVAGKCRAAVLPSVPATACTTHSRQHCLINQSPVYQDLAQLDPLAALTQRRLHGLP